MKKVKTIFPKITFILLLAVLLSSCSKDEDITNTSDFYLTAKIDGEDFTADPKNTLVSFDPMNTQIFTITGINNSGARITLTLPYPSPDPIGTFDTYFDENIFMSYVSPFVDIWGASESSSFGQITISKNNNEFVEGEFFFTGSHPTKTETIEITNGIFRAKKL